MSGEQETRKSYPSDLKDEQWAIVEPLLPTPHTQHGGRPRELDMREVLNTLLYLGSGNNSRNLVSYLTRSDFLRRVIGAINLCIVSHLATVPLTLTPR